MNLNIVFIWVIIGLVGVLVWLEWRNDPVANCAHDYEYIGQAHGARSQSMGTNYDPHIVICPVCGHVKYLNEPPFGIRSKDFDDTRMSEIRTALREKRIK